MITGKQLDRVGHILDYDYVDQLEQNEGLLIRHNRDRGDVLSAGDMTAAGVMLMQIWVSGNTANELIAKEREVRSKIYAQAQDDCVYRAYWNVE